MPKLRQELEAFRIELNLHWRFVLATFAASGIGYLGSAAAPVIVQALLDSGLRHQQAGDLGTIELTTLALSSTLMTPLVAHVSHRKLALGGAVTAAAGLVISALSTSYALMMIGRIVIGSGSGLAISGANAAVAAREDAERIFAIIWTMGGAITATLALYLPTLTAGGNYPVGFGALLLLTLAGLPLMLWLPHRPAGPGGPSSTSADPATPSGAAPVTHASPEGRFGPFGLMAALVLSGFFLYSATEQALWQFSFDVAVSNGIPELVAGEIIGFTVVMGLVGGAFAAWLGLRLGRIFPVVLGSLISLAGRWIYITATSTEVLWVGGLLWGLGFYFVSPYQMGLAAALDRRGRVAVAAGGILNLGYGLGPSMGGRIRQYQVDNDLDASILVLAIAGGTFLSLVLLLPVAMRLDRSRPRSARPGGNAGQPPAGASGSMR